MELTQTGEACPHCWDDAAMRRPPASVLVHRDECAYCCRTCEPQNSGIYVCMSCFTGLCGDHVAKHRAIKPAHTMYTVVRELLEEPNNEEEEAKDVYKLGVVKPKTYESFVCCAECKVRLEAAPELAVDSYSGILNAPMPGAQEATLDSDGALFMKPQCPHLVCLEQQPSPFSAGQPPTSDDVCAFEGCDCRVNNWMCVTCGAIGCPRTEAGGNGHARKHFELTGHPAAVKLGTVTPSGADYYCYDCDDDVDDVHFREHMLHFGIDVETAKKTAKTMGEMQYDYSTQFDFNKITEAGSDLVLVFGPGHTGIRNIGNSCYIASVVQCLSAMAPFQRAFYTNGVCKHQEDCSVEPYDCRTCQTERLLAGLLSGEFSKAGENQRGVGPRQFKKVYAQKHAEFSTGQQQDAQEYFLYLLEEMKRFVKPAGAAGGTLRHPCDVFELLMEQRVQCSKCQRVRYTYEKESCLSLPIPLDPSTSAVTAVAADGVKLTEEQLDALRPCCNLDECLMAASQANGIECRCEACGEAATYLSTTRMGSFPDILPVYLRRTYFDVQSLTTKKMDVYVDVPQELDLSAFRASGKQPDETEMPKASTSAGPAVTKVGKKEREVDETSLAMVVSMGIDVAVARYALLQTDMNVERAVDYIFSHPEIEAEMAIAAGEAGQSSPANATMDPEAPQSPPTDGVGKYRLVSMISHIGSGAKVGHYVCHVKDSETGKWILFNDEKAGESQHPPFKMASMFFYERCA